jgi:hypothetical protein
MLRIRVARYAHEMVSLSASLAVRTGPRRLAEQRRELLVDLGEHVGLRLDLLGQGSVVVDQTFEALDVVLGVQRDLRCDGIGSLGRDQQRRRLHAFTRFTGRAELFDRLTRIIGEQGDQRRHVMGNILVEELDLAAGTALAFSVVTVAANGLSVGASVIYTADLRREDDGCWRISYFFIGMDSYAGEKPKAGEK